MCDPVGDLAAATRAAAVATRRLGLPEAQLIRTSMNAIFAAGDDVVLRVGHTTVEPRAAVDLAELLTAAGVRVPRPLAEPIVVDDLSVLPIERVHPGGAPDWERVGCMVAVVHGLDIGAIRRIGYPLPRCPDFPWWQLDSMLGELDSSIDRPARRGLLAAIERYLPVLRATRETHTTVLHGDVHTGNVLSGPDGPVLIDWDLLCRGPRAWDHAPLMREPRWGGDAAIYDAFAKGYGVSLLGDPLAEAIAELRLVAATLMRVAAGRSNSAAKVEAEQRLAYWRDDPAAPAWIAQ